MSIDSTYSEFMRCYERYLVVTVRRVTPGDGQSAAYHAGKIPPRYPMPAIDICYIGRYGVYIGSVDAKRDDYPIVLASNI